MEEEKHELSIVEPIAPTEKLVEAMKRFEDLKKQLLAEDDWQVIWVKVRDPDTGEERREKKKFIKRTGFRKLALAFGLSTKLASEQRVDRPDLSFMWKIQVEVTAPNGRSCVGMAVCDSRERGFAHPEHDVYSTAYTRALNRGISDMIAGGVVSAEEIEAPETPEKTQEKGIVPAGNPQVPMVDASSGSGTKFPGAVKGHLSENKLARLKTPPRTPDSRSITPNQSAMITTKCRELQKSPALQGYDALKDILRLNGAEFLGKLTFEQAEAAIEWLDGL